MQKMPRAIYPAQLISYSSSRRRNDADDCYTLVESPLQIQADRVVRWQRKNEFPGRVDVSPPTTVRICVDRSKPFIELRQGPETLIAIESRGNDLLADTVDKAKLTILDNRVEVR